MNPSETPERVGILYRGDRTAPVPTRHPLFDPLAGELAARGIVAEAVIYADDAVEPVRDELLRLDGVLVWFDPIAGGEDRVRLDALLREVAARGVQVSADPDVILAMGTKEVLFRTRSLGWGMETRLYASPAQLEEELPGALSEGIPCVLLRHGTDTGIGETFVTAALARALRAAGIEVGVMKPIETGVPVEGPQDALALRLAAGVDDPLEDVCPQIFGLPAAPEAAARVEGRSVSWEAIRGAFDRLSARHEFMLVEGAGGLLVPIDSRADMADLVRELALPLLVVARPGLGTVNHTRLTLEAARSRGLPVVGVVISHSRPESDESEGDRRNLDGLRERLGDLLLGELRFEAARRETIATTDDVRSIIPETPADGDWPSRRPHRPGSRGPTR